MEIYKSLRILQESIDGEVTTRPSAILRQGTDITSNDPDLTFQEHLKNLTYYKLT